MTEEKKAKPEELKFACTWRGNTVLVTASTKDEKTKVTTYGKKIVFSNFQTALDPVAQKEEIIHLANRSDFENDQPGAKHFWPLDADAFNKFAEENNIPKVGRTGSTISIAGAAPGDIAAIARLDVANKKVADLQNQLKALQDATPSSSKKKA